MIIHVKIAKVQIQFNQAKFLFGFFCQLKLEINELFGGNAEEGDEDEQDDMFCDAPLFASDSVRHEFSHNES